MGFEYKTKEMEEIVKKVESGRYGIVFLEGVDTHMGNMIMELEMQGYSINEFDEDEDENGHDSKNFILTMVSVRNGFGGIQEMEITPKLAKEVKEYQEFLRKQDKIKRRKE